MPAIGSLISGYRVERVLGSGGMGTVYLVANPELPRKEAMKLLSAELSRDEGFRTRFTREAEVAAQLEHPNIVPIYRRGHSGDGRLWIVMQFVDGTNADEAVQSGRMTPERAVHIVAKVAKALDFAHAHNVIHRDVKPANFLLSGPVGPDERVMLADFGIARAYDDAHLTGTGQVLTTAAYAAPEVLSGQPATGRSDQYALGCALYRLLTGSTPFAGTDGQAAVLMAHLTQPPPRVTDRAPWLPPEMDSVIATVMAKDPTYRFASCGDLADAAKAALQSRGRPGWGAAPVAQATRAAHATHTAQPSPAAHASFLASPPGGRLGVAPGAPALRPTRPDSGRRNGIIVAAGLTLVAAVVLTVIAIAWPANKPAQVSDSTTTPTAEAAGSSAPTTTETKPPIPTAQLADLLLTAEETGRIFNVPMVATTAAPESVLSEDRADTADTSACMGAVFPVQVVVYDGSGWSAVRQHTLNQRDGEANITLVIEGVVSFRSVGAANAAYAHIGDVFQSCSGQVVKHGENASRLGRNEVTPAGVRTIATDGTDGILNCGRAVAVQDNVIIDTFACVGSHNSIAGQIVDKTAALATGIRDKVDA